MVQIQHRAQVPERVALQLREHERREHRGIDAGPFAEVDPFPFQHADIEGDVLPDEESILWEVFEDIVAVLGERGLPLQIRRPDPCEYLHHRWDVRMMKKLLVFLPPFPVAHLDRREFDDSVRPRHEPRGFGIEDDEREGGEVHRGKNSVFCLTPPPERFSLCPYFSNHMHDSLQPQEILWREDLPPDSSRIDVEVNDNDAVSFMSVIEGFLGEMESPNIRVQVFTVCVMDGEKRVAELQNGPALQHYRDILSKGQAVHAGFYYKIMSA